MYAFNSYGYLVKNVQGSMITTYSYNGEPHEPVTKATKAQFIAKANEWVTGKNGFCNSILEYKQEQITYKKGDVVKTFHHIEYDGEGQEREFKVFTTETGANTVAGDMYSGDNLSSKLKEETVADVTYEINDKEIIYKDPNAEFIHSSYKELHINKYGYVTLQLSGNGAKSEYIYNGDPEDPSTELNLNWDSGRTSYFYQYTTAVTQNQKFKALINYRSSDSYNQMAFMNIQDWNYVTIGIGEPTKTINITSIEDLDGNDLLSQCSIDKDTQQVLYLNKDSGGFSKKIIVRFTVTQALSIGFYSAASFKTSTTLLI